MSDNKTSESKTTAVELVEVPESSALVDSSASAAPVDPREETRALERKADAIRREVDLLIAEADKRRHRLFTRQLQKHPLSTAVAALMIGVGAVGLTVFLTRRYQERHSLSGRLAELGRAASGVARRPDRIGRRDPNLPTKLVAAISTAVVGALAKRGVAGLVPEKR